MGFYTLTGSHCSNHNYWSGYAASRGSGRTTVIINNKSDGCCGSRYNYGGYDNIFGGGCCGGGYADKYTLTGLGIGAGIGLLASPFGGTIMKGIGTGFKYLGLGFKYAGIGIGKAASWTYNNVLKPTGKFLWNSVLKPVGQGIGEFFTRLGRFCIGKGWTTGKEAA